MKMGTLEWIVFILVIIGGLNWGLIGFLNYNLVDSLFGVGSGIARVIYALVGLSAIWMVFMAPKMTK